MIDDVGVAIIKASNRHLLFGDTSGKVRIVICIFYIDTIEFSYRTLNGQIDEFKY